jgi:diguanylate cyclase (GGDEF)-like protein/PAS domain S-box-containing protein
MKARRSVEAALAESESRYRALVELSPNAIVVHRHGVLLYANPLGAALVGAPAPEAVAGRRISDVIHPDYHRQTLERIEILERENRPLPPVEIVVRRLDGVDVPCEVVSGLTTFDGEPAVQSVLRDVSRRRRLEDELRHLATTDPLTGACNRRYFFERFAVEWTRAGRHGRPLSVMMVDVDRLKEINDCHGHAAGDRTLVSLAETCRQVLRAEDLLARLGGDEFAVILPEADLEDACAVAERVRRRLAAEGDTGLDPSPPFTVSVGVAQCDLEHGSPERCLQRADAALLAAKRAGRDAVARG